MGIFDIFKKKKKSEAEDDYNKAQAQFDQGEYQEALQTLSWAFKKDVSFEALYSLAASTLFNLGAEEEASLFKEAQSNLNSFDSFRTLGEHFFNVAHYDLALPFLEKAVELEPSNSETIHDLAIALSRRFQINKAIELLEKDNHYQDDFWNFWFWCKLRILGNKPEGIKEALLELKSFVENAENQEGMDVPKQKVLEVQEIFERFSTIENPKMEIRDWHYIQYGGMILDFFDDCDDYVAGGRYVASWGQIESIKEVLQKLVIFLKDFDITFKTVKYVDDRNSEILGLVIAKELSLEAQVYSATDLNMDCLIVAANTEDLDDFPELCEIKKNQVIFAYNHDWLQASVITPDIIGSMNQTFSFPWDGGGLRVIDAEKGLIEKTESDNRNSDVIADEIYNLKNDIEMDESQLDFYKEKRGYLKGIGVDSGTIRYNFMIESPVPGSYFG